jgi:Ni,Fe-hydrogenase III small subunit
VSAALQKRFGRSLKLRSVSAGGCNGCELEVNALTNVNFDIGRYGIDIVASPRHADGLVLTGPVTRNMAEALQLVLGRHARAQAGDRGRRLRHLRRPFAGLAGARPHASSSASSRRLYVPGCPPHPLTFISGILDLLGIAS